MILKMDKASTSSSWELAQRLYDKNIELENRRRKSAQARVPSDPNAWQQMRENFETIILEDHNFSEKHNIEFTLWQLHYRRIEEFRAHYSAASTTGATASQTRGGVSRSDRASKIRLQFKTFLSEATGFYHDLILKIRAKYGLPIGQFSPGPENHNVKDKNGKRFVEMKKGLISCHRCLIYLGDLARYKGLYGEGDSKSRDYAAASSYYLQAASLWPSSGNPHHQLAILATYSGDELMAVYRYFRSLAAENPFSTARDNLIVAFEKNRQSYSQVHGDSKALSIKESTVRSRGGGRGKVESVVQSKEPTTDTDSDMEGATEIRQTYKAFRVGFVRLNGILFTRTSLETFDEILSLVTSDLEGLLSSGPEEELNFGTEPVENGLFVVILISIIVFTVNNVKKGESEGQSYADIVQHTVLLENSLIAFYDLMGRILKRCLQLSDASSSFLLPGVLVCVEWMACHPDVALRNETNGKQTTSRVNFLTHCISLFNKLLSEGIVPTDDEDVSCFTNMATYEEGENEYQLALWEDFELRGFLPLLPAQAFLDFSQKHSLGGDSKKDKVARVKRIFAAGKVIADMVTIDHKPVRFDSKQKKFVIGIDDQKHTTGSSSSSNGVKREETLTVTQPKVEEVEEEDDEVIVFKPTVVDNQWDRQECSENVQNASVGPPQFTDIRHQNAAGYTDSVSESLLPATTNLTPNFWKQDQFDSPMWSANRQVSLSGGLKGLSLFENGHVTKPGMPREIDIPNAASFSNQLVTQVKSDTIKFPGADSSSIVARNMLPTSSSKVSTNRPVRHHGPPPGFSSVRPKQVNEVNSALGQNPLNDDYSWLDGYQLQSSMKSGFIQPSNLGSQFTNGSVSTNSFPFPGKQVPVVQFGVDKQGRPTNSESLNPNNESLHQQYVSQLDQQQGQPMWKGNHFV